MSQKSKSFSEARRRLLRRIGFGAIASGVAMAIGGPKVFASQFLGDAPSAKNPKMVYDPDLQMMVSPKTGKPVYEMAKTCSEWTPIVTPGTDGPTGDGKTDYWDC